MLLFINPFTSVPYKSVQVSAISSYPPRSGFSPYIPLFCGGDLFHKIIYSLKGGNSHAQILSWVLTPVNVRLAADAGFGASTRGHRRFDHGGAAGDPGLHATYLSGAQLHLDTGLLGVGTRRLLLGARHGGDCPSGGGAVDSGVLGLGGWRLRLARRVLGAARRFLRRHQLRLRLLRSRI